MTHDPAVPVETSPPRPVYQWTRVVGHDVHSPSDTLGGAKYYCSCGWQSFGGSYTERDGHLAAVWPVLVPKPASGSMTEWVGDIEEALRDAESAEAAIDLAERGALTVREGEEMPTISEESSLAHDRVRVLRHQLIDVMERANMDTRYIPRD